MATNEGKPPKPLAKYIADDLPKTIAGIDKDGIFFSKIPLGYAEWRILAYLDESPYVDAKGLAERMEYSRASSTFWDYIDDLADKGLVKFTGFPEYGLLLTEKGRDFIDTYKEVKMVLENAMKDAQKLIEKYETEIAQKIRPYVTKINALIATENTLTVRKLIEILKARFPCLSLDEARALYAELRRRKVWVGTKQIELVERPSCDLASFVTASVYGKETDQNTFRPKGEWG